MRLRLWKCTSCRRLSITSEGEKAPLVCGARLLDDSTCFGSEFTEVPLRPSRE